MDIKKIVLLMVALAFLCTPAFAGEQPEYDVVGCDATAFFNDWVKYIVCMKNTLYDTVTLNQAGDFCKDGDCLDLTGDEWFDPPSPILTVDPCFGCEVVSDNPGVTIFPPYPAAKIGAGNSGVYRWRIVLQKKPESDLNINIVDCVVKMNSSTMFGTNPFEGAGQTGLKIYPWGQIEFVAAANPSIAVALIPGPYADANFTAPVNGIARALPGLGWVGLGAPGHRYTSKGPWQEGIVAVRPTVLDMGFTLRQGDMVEVTISVPPTNTMDIRYGAHSVIIKYVGIHGDIYFRTDDLGNPVFCGPCRMLPLLDPV